MKLFFKFKIYLLKNVFVSKSLGCPNENFLSIDNLLFVFKFKYFISISSIFCARISITLVLEDINKLLFIDKSFSGKVYFFLD